MARSSNFLFARTIDGKPVMISEEYVVPRSAPQPKRASKIILTVLIAVIGIGAGWIGGKMLNGRFGSAPAAALPIDASSDHSQAESTSPAKRNSDVENRSALRAKTTPEDEEAVVKTEPSTKDAASTASPPKVPRIEKEEEGDEVTGQDPSKEIGRNALKKIKKETKKTKKHGPDNENEQN